MCCCEIFCFFFSSRRRHTRSDRDWSSDVCSSDLNPPEGWSADKAEGSTDDIGGTKITSVHRDYKKGEGDTAATTSISILDSAANPDYVSSTTAAWSMSTSTTEGYTKTLTIEGMPGVETC